MIVALRSLFAGNQPLVLEGYELQLYHLTKTDYVNGVAVFFVLDSNKFVVSKLKYFFTLDQMDHLYIPKNLSSFDPSMFEPISIVEHANFNCFTGNNPFQGPIDISK